MLQMELQLGCRTKQGTHRAGPGLSGPATLGASPLKLRPPRSCGPLCKQHGADHSAGYLCAPWDAGHKQIQMLSAAVAVQQEQEQGA